MVAENQPRPDQRVWPPTEAPSQQFAPRAHSVTSRAVWRLLNRGLEAFLPERVIRPEQVRYVDAPPIGELPVFLAGESGFGLHLAARNGGHPPEREIFVRGREGQSIGSIGIVIVGSSPRIGARLIDAPRLFRYARELTFETIYEPRDPGSVVSAIQAARAVENIVFLDLALGIGLCAELDPVTRNASCPLLVRFGGRGTVAVAAYDPHFRPRALTA
jgi:hypothetical protein